MGYSTTTSMQIYATFSVKCLQYSLQSLKIKKSHITQSLVIVLALGGAAGSRTQALLVDWQQEFLCCVCRATAQISVHLICITNESPLYRDTPEWDPQGGESMHEYYLDVWVENNLIKCNCTYRNRYKYFIQITIANI